MNRVHRSFVAYNGSGLGGAFDERLWYRFETGNRDVQFFRGEVFDTVLDLFLLLGRLGLHKCFKSIEQEPSGVLHTRIHASDLAFLTKLFHALPPTLKRRSPNSSGVYLSCNIIQAFLLVGHFLPFSPVPAWQLGEWRQGSNLPIWRRKKCLNGCYGCVLDFSRSRFAVRGVRQVAQK